MVETVCPLHANSSCNNQLWPLQSKTGVATYSKCLCPSWKVYDAHQQTSLHILQSPQAVFDESIGAAYQDQLLLAKAGA